MTTQEQEFWGDDFCIVVAERERLEGKQVTKSTITAEDIAIFERERARLAEAEQSRRRSRAPRGKYWGECWECGCDGWLDSDGYCGC